MNNNSLLYYSLVFLIFIKVGNAQVKDSVLEYQRDLYTKSHIVLNLNTIPISSITPLLKKRKKIAVYLSDNKRVNMLFVKLYKAYNDSLIVLHNDEFNISIAKDLYLIHIRSDDLETITLTKNKAIDSMPLNFFKTNKINHVKIDDDVEFTDSLYYKIWLHSGKTLNLIEPQKASFLKTDSIVSRFNSLKKVFGVVETENGELIKDVRFKGYEESVINGHFSFPILEGEDLPVLIPYKAGYHFSPDILFTTPENIGNSKKFNAFQLDLEFGLSDHFVFAPSFKNRIEENDKELLLNNVAIIEDSVLGKVGYFNNGSYIDVGIESKKSLKKSFTIAVWVKPTSLSLNNSILGKGDNFVVKLNKGFLTFTMAGIKDYISELSPIPLNTWSHIALTHSEIDNKLFFYVNGKLTEEVKLISEYVTSDYNILIGTNLWEEFFDGYLADIKIWERELNGNEIANLFKKKDKRPLKEVLKIGFFVLIILLTVSIIILRKKIKSKNKKNLQSKHRKKIKKSVILASNKDGRNNIESILCFGKLRILNKESVDIAEKLPPLLKKIFVIVFLYSHQGSKRGIPTKQLTEFLWPGMNSKKAKNTRGTNINNLRSILNSCSEINLVFKNKSWFVEFTENCYCDYQVIQTYLYSFLNEAYTIKELENEIPKFLEILKEGRLFSSSSESWLDPFIDKFSNQIVEQCLDFTKILSIDTHSDLLFLLTEVICIYDDLNEKAHQLKLQILIQQGKLSLAYKTYDNFVKLYFKIYKETYATSFEEMTSSGDF